MRRRPFAIVAVVALVVLGLLAAMPDFWPDEPAGAPAAVPLAPVAVLGRPLRLAVMGTSVTARYAWPRELAAALSQCLPDPVELRVFAKAGMGSAWGETMVADVARFAPDIVLIEFAGNDSDLRHLRSIAGSRATHRRLIAALRADGRTPSIALMAMNPAFGLRGALRPNLPGFYAMYASLARETGAGLIDFTSLWHEALRQADRASLLPDGLHPTEAAQARIMRAGLLPALGAALKDAYPACALLGGAP